MVVEELKDTFQSLPPVHKYLRARKAFDRTKILSKAVFSKRKRSGSSQPNKKRKRNPKPAPASRVSRAAMPRYGRARLRFGGGRKNRRRGRKGRSRRSRKRRGRGRSVRLYRTVRPATRIIKLSFLQHVSIDPLKSHWQYFKFYPADLTHQIFQHSVQLNADELDVDTLSPMYRGDGDRRRWLDLRLHQSNPDSGLFDTEDVVSYARFNGASISAAQMDIPASVRSGSTITTLTDCKKRPYGFDQWVGSPGTADEYHKYKVLGCKMSMEHIPTAATTEGSIVYMGFTKQDSFDFTLAKRTAKLESSEVASFMNQGFVKNWQVFSSGSLGSKVTGFYSAKKAMRAWKRKGEADVQAQFGTQTAPPDLNPALNFVMAMPGQGDPGGQTLLFRATWVVQLSDYTPPAQSVAI